MRETKYVVTFVNPEGKRTPVYVSGSSASEVEHRAWAAIYATLDAPTAALLRVDSTEVDRE